MFAQLSSFALACLVIASCPPAGAQQQIVDPDFKPEVAHPTYAGAGPVVAMDEAHGNFHTVGGQYRPFADLLSLDGYRVIASSRKFDTGAFAGIGVLVVANANSGAAGGSAFTDPECEALHAWVEAGGSLLLIADHAPFGVAAEKLAQRFHVGMGKGYAYEPTADSVTTQLVYSRESGRLGAHPVLEGRDKSERIDLVKVFTGQSLIAPDGASVLLRLSETAREAPDTRVLDAAAEAVAEGQTTPPPNTISVAGRVQGLAMNVGRGKVVVLGEAGMFSAQAVKFPPGSGQKDFKFGMNVPGTDDQQFALNVLHWLSGALDR